MTNQGGFIKLVIIIIVIIAILSYFNINIRSITESDLFKENFSYVWNWIVFAWDNYLERPFVYVWNDIFLDLIWNPSIDALRELRNGGTPDLFEKGPSIDFKE